MIYRYGNFKDGHLRQAKYLLLFTVLALSFALNLVAQPVSQLKWHDPSKLQNPVIEGRGWQSGLSSPYNRLPEKAESLVRKPVWELSEQSAGLSLRFITNATTIVVRYKVAGDISMPHMPATGVSGVDLYSRSSSGDWRWAHGRYSFHDTIEYRFSNLNLQEKKAEFRLYLPLYNKVTWLEIGVDEKSEFSFPEVQSGKPIVLYGTSILQGACAGRPGLAWTNILGRKIDIPLINLGFSGNGQLEKPLLDLMMETDACLYVLDCMPNLISPLRFEKKEVEQRIIDAVNLLQSRNSSIPVILTEHSAGRTGTDMDSSLIRNFGGTSKILNDLFQRLKTEGKENIYLLTGNEMGMDIESTVDGTHPNDAGMMKIADAYEKLIRKILFTDNSEEHEE